MLLQKRYIVFFVSILTVTTLIFSIIAIYFGNNPLNNRLSSKINAVSILPEGWAFFTRDANEPRQYIFKVNGAHLTEVNLRNFSSEYYFGMSRFNRVLYLEFNSVFQNITKDTSHIEYLFHFTNLNNVVNDLHIDTLKFNKINIDKKNTPNIQGKYVIVVELMLPWSLLHHNPDYPTDFIVFPLDLRSL